MELKRINIHKTMKRIKNVALLAILMALISILLVPLALYGNRIGYHCLNMAQSFAMFCIGTWISEYLRNRLNRRTLTVIGIFIGVCILQYSSIKIYALMGCGTGTGSTRIEDAVKSALESPLINDFDLSTAKNVLVNITTGENPDGLTMSQYGEVIMMIENRTEIG